jgi:glycerate-2-kinase
MAYPAQVISLILSDVVGNRLSSIASGPTVLRRPPLDDATGVLKKYQIWNVAPENVKAALTAHGQGLTRSRRPKNILIGTNELAVRAAAKEAQALGFKPKVISLQLHGEASQVGIRFAKRLLRAPPLSCLLMGGETTVTVLGNGKGGRNQEFSLAAASVLAGQPGIVVFSFATDGIDGPTDAAGAVATGETIPMALDLALDPVGALKNNDSYPLLNETNSLIRTGPTGTNVNDLAVGLVYPVP